VDRGRLAPPRVEQLAARLASSSRRPVGPAAVTVALKELRAAGLTAVDGDDEPGLVGCWSAVPVTRDPLLDAVDLHGAHDFRHTRVARPAKTTTLHLAATAPSSTRG